MFLKLSPDPKRAKGIFRRYLELPTDDYVMVDKSAIGLKAGKIEETSSKNKNAPSFLLLLSPEITILGQEASVIITTHPSLSGGEMRIITPDRKKADVGMFTLRCPKNKAKEIEELPYHFRLSLMLHDYRGKV
jgi:hypothetical protein